MLDGGLGFSFTGGSSSSDAAKDAAKKIAAAVKKAGQVQAKATEKSAELGLEAQKIRTEGEVTKATRDTVIKWSAIAGGAIIAVLGVLYLINRRRQARKNVVEV
jgi:hypothetical protein